MSIFLYIAVMALTTYLIRMIPFTLLRRKIRSRFFRSFLYYMPYAVLAAMTFPAVFFSTGSVLSASVGAAVAIALSLCDLPMTLVAVAAALVAFLI